MSIFNRSRRGTDHAVMVYCDAEIGSSPWSLKAIVEVLRGQIVAINGEYDPQGQTLESYFYRLTSQYGYGHVQVNELRNPVR